MFIFSILIGIYSYIIFAVGILGLLQRNIIIAITIIYLLLILFFLRKSIRNCNLRLNLFKFLKNSTKFEFFILAIIFVQAAINLIGALGPELGFDVLWYHLTLPKIYLENHRIFFISGGLFYYSAMPKLIEMFYIVGNSLGGETLSKLINYSFGIFSLIALYQFSRRYLSKTGSLLVLTLFYSNLVVGWMSISAYVDLGRTFFELMALWGFVIWVENKKLAWFVLSAILMGFAITAKFLAIGSLLIISALIIYVYSFEKKSIGIAIKKMLEYWSFALLIVVPWLLYSLFSTGNPVYPFFTNIYPIKPNFYLINPLNLSDPISPLYLIFLPVALILYKNIKYPLKIIALYSFIAIMIWYLTPQTGGGRFILPYLPELSIITVAVIYGFKQKILRNIFVVLIVVMGMFSIFYRGAANFKYVPVILGKESKSQFLSSHLNFSFGDFYDTDGYFGKHIKNSDRVLLYGFHNLYYLNFPFIDASYVKDGDTFSYILVQGSGELPDRFKFWKQIYYNQRTNVKLYSAGGSKWVY